MHTSPPPPWRLLPVRGTCRWVNRRCRVLRINHTLYTLVPARSHYRLVNWCNGNVYDVDAGGRWCTCPSFVWDHCPVQAGGDGRCKHVAALRTLGVLPEAPAQDAEHAA
jgi:SWIM zinc finger